MTETRDHDSELSENSETTTPMRRRAMLSSVAAAGVALAGCSGENGTPTPEPATSETSTSTETETPAPADNGTPTTTEVEAAISEARGVYAESISSLKATEVTEVQDGQFVLGATTDDGVEPFFNKSREGVVGPAQEMRKRLESLKPKASGEYQRRVEKLVNVGTLIGFKWRLYDSLSRAFLKGSNAFSLYMSGRAKEAVGPAREAVSFLGTTGERRSAMADGLEETREIDVELQVPAWDAEQWVAEMEFIGQLAFEYNPAFSGLAKLSEGSTAAQEGARAIQNESYEEAVALSREAKKRYTAATTQLTTAQDRGLRYYAATFDQLRCFADESRADVVFLIESAEAYADGKTETGEQKYDEYVEAVRDVSCGGGTPTPSA